MSKGNYPFLCDVEHLAQKTSCLVHCIDSVINEGFFSLFSVYLKCQSIRFACFSPAAQCTHTHRPWTKFTIFSSLLCLFCRKPVLITRAFVLYFFRACSARAEKCYSKGCWRRQRRSCWWKDSNSSIAWAHQMHNGMITFAITACRMHFTRVQNYEALMSIQFRVVVCDFFHPLWHVLTLYWNISLTYT